MQHRLPRELRIIAGEWRGRKLRFPDRTEIRPTPDRVRETLFNWIGTRVRGVRALDLFAGSGALGLECLSRGAVAATFIDSDPRALQARFVESSAGAWWNDLAQNRRMRYEISDVKQLDLAADPGMVLRNAGEATS